MPSIIIKKKIKSVCFRNILTFSIYEQWIQTAYVKKGKPCPPYNKELLKARNVLNPEPAGGGQALNSEPLNLKELKYTILSKVYQIFTPALAINLCLTHCF